ncbi:hypothetical protein [Streptomyces sp. NPDC002573]|uniref:hypothetical protein n=1 Tax=Streptomyces sp. NPDC002573 TaxID=3364651 RepID=UPI0036BFAD71
MSLPVDVPGNMALGLLSRFRVEFHECLYARMDALFELTVDPPSAKRAAGSAL